MLSKKLFGLFAGLLCLAATFSASAQNLTVRGTVVDAAGPVVGAVVLSGSANAVTDMNGAYTINVPSNAVLEVSCLGYVTQQIPVNGRTNINVVLVEDAEVLQEAVALGYGAQTKKKDLSAAVGIVGEPDKIAERPVTSITHMLQGQIPGVVVSNNGGKPTDGASLLIRGQGSRNGDSVLWVVDGVPGASVYSMNDIESIVVLKDAASAAIYGATSGAGGVILVTTKKASKGIHVEYDVVAGVRSAYNLPEPLTAQEEIQMKTISHANAGISLPSGWDTSVNPWVGVQRTNWMDECFRVAPYQRHSVTLNYGTDVFKSRLTFSYQNNQGIMVGTYKKNLAVRYKGDYQMNKWLQFTETMSYDDGYGRGVDDNSAHTGVILSALWMPASAEAYATAGPYAGMYGGTTTEDPEYIAKYGSNFADIHGDTVNPLRLLLASDEWGHNVDFWSTTGVHITPIRGLKLSSLFSIDVNNVNSKSFSPGRYEVGKRETGNRLSVSASRNFKWISESTITYDRTFGKHTVGALGAFTINNTEQQGFGGYGVGLADESPKMQFMKFASSKDINSDYFNMDRNIAFVSRVSYSYDDRYFMTASYRRDYAGRLPDAHNYGDFPAVTGAWKVSSEPFFPKNDVVSLLKFRASWGRVGNLGSVGWHYKSNTLSSSNWNEAPNYGIAAGQTFGTFWYPANAINNELTWETSETLDGGVDIDMFNDRLSISVDGYSKRTFNLIQDQTMGWPATIGRNAMKVNQGEISNRGIEFIATWRDKIGKDFSYHLSANFAYNHNEVISTGILDDEGNPGKWTGGGDWGGVPWLYQSEPGQPLNSFFVIKTDGIFQSMEDVYDHQKDGKLIQPNAQPGDLRFVDFNNDGKIDTNDRQYVGSAMPKQTFAFSAGFNWKGFYADIMFQGVAGNKIAYVGKSRILSDVEGNFSRAKEIFNSWSPENPHTYLPRLSKNDPNGNYSQPSDFYIEDGSYLRLKNLTIGYDLTEVMRKVPHFADRNSSCSIYLSGENLLTWTNYSGMDPEVGGFDTIKYPVSRVFAIGLKLNY